MTKIIGILMIALVVWGGWNLFLYWDKVSQEKENEARQTGIVPEQLPGLPQGLENPLQTAQRAGTGAMREWLKFYRASVQDPRLAWIELDFAVMVSRDNIQEARRVFASVKDRTTPSSPVYPRVKQLEKTFE